MAVSSSIPASVSSSPSTFETRTNIITPAHTHGLKAPSSYPIGLNLSKFNIGSFLKSDTGCLNAYTSISSSLNHFNPSITSTPFYFSETVSPYVPHRKRRENKPRRQRTTFSSEQTLKLEMEYRRAEYVTRTRRLELADDLQLTETQIKIWYQNRRAKDKRIEKAHIDQHFRSISLNNMSAGSPYPALNPSVHGMYGWDPWVLRSQMEAASSKGQG